MNKELLKGLNEQQIAKLNKCHSSEEILSLAKQEGVELTSEQLEAVNGGFCTPEGSSVHPERCPICNGTNTKFVQHCDMGKMVWDEYECLDCKKEYRVKIGGY